MADALNELNDGQEPRQQDRDKSETIQRFWVREIGRYERQFKNWETSGDKVMKLYRKQLSVDSSSRVRRFAMLWANTEVLKPKCYARVPVPIVSRRFKGRDPAGRLASELLERNLSYEIDRGQLHSKLKKIRDDLLLPGRGQLWVRVEDKQDGYKCLAYDYVYWKDFGHTLARTWEEVTAVWRKVYLTKQEIADRFFEGDIHNDLLREIELDHKMESQSSQDANPVLTAGSSKATIYEIWDRKKAEVVFIAKGGQVPLEIAPPYVDLTTFWPCPVPAYATLSTESLEPTPDYHYYRDQAEEIDHLTKRISSLTDSLKVVGFYPAGVNEADIAKALTPGFENKLIAIDNWAAFSEKGGTSSIVWLPIEAIVAVITACVTLRQQLVSDVYELTGLSDIARGASDPDETAKAQEIKRESTSDRLKDKQGEMVRIGHEAIMISAEIISEYFDPKQVVAVADKMPLQPQPDEFGQVDPAVMQEAQEQMQELEAAFEILKSDKLRGFKIDIETDSTIYPDEHQDRADRNEFTLNVSNFIREAIPVVQAIPVSMPLIKALLMFNVRGYRSGRELEDEIEQTTEAMQQQLEQQLQQQAEAGAAAGQVDPAQVEAQQAEMGLKDQEMQMKQAKHDQDMQIQMQQHEMAQQAATQQQDEVMFQRGVYERKMLQGEDQMALENPAGGPLAQALLALAQQMAMAQEQNTQMMQQMMMLLAAPKRSQIIRDAQGNVVGAEQVVDQAPAPEMMN